MNVKRVPGLWCLIGMFLFSCGIVVPDARAGGIDPEPCFLQWSTLLGGAGDNERTRIATAPDGDLIVAAGTTDASWLSTIAPVVHTFGPLGSGDIVILRLSADGSIVRWATVIGGTGSDDGVATNQSIGVLPDNSIALCGAASHGFPTVNAFDSSFAPGIRYKAFMSRLSADGSTLLFSTLFGGNAGESEFYALSVDSNGRLVGCGRTDASDFQATSGAYQTVHGGGRDAFVASFDFSGQLLHATLLGGAANDEFLTLQVDPPHQAIVVGGYSATSGIVGWPDDYDTTLNGSNDGVLARFDDTLATLRNFTYLGGSSGEELVYALDLDFDGGPVAILNTPTQDLPVIPSDWPHQQGGADPFVFKLAPDWSTLMWSTYAGGSTFDAAYALTQIPGGDWMIAGESNLLDLDPTCEISGSDHGAFLERLSPASARILGAFAPGGRIGYGLALQPSGRVVFAGDVTSAVDFPFHPPTLQPTYGGGTSDGFLLAVDPVMVCPPPPPCFVEWSTLLGGPGEFERTRVAVAPDGDIVVATGTTNSTWLSGISPVVRSFGTLGNGDIVVMRMSGDGSVVRWADVIGGSGSDDGVATSRSVAVLPDNSIVICGAGTTGFPVVNAYDPSIPGPLRYKGVLTRLSADGDSLLFSTFFGGNAQVSEFYSVAIDPAGRIFASGRTDASDFPASPDAYQITPGGDRDAFIASFTFNGALIKATRFGGVGNEEFLALKLDPSRNAVVVGGYSSTSGLHGPAGDYDSTLDGARDGIVARFNDGLSTLEHFTYVGGSSDSEVVYALDLDVDGGPVSILNTTSSNLPVVPGSWPHQVGGTDPFVFKLAPDWSSLNWSTYAGGTAYDAGYAISRLPDGDWMIAGESNLLDLGLPCEAFGADHGAFVERLSPAATRAKVVYSPGGFIGYGLALQGNGNLIFAGDVTTASGFPFTPPTIQNTYGGGANDGFVLTLDPEFSCVVDVANPEVGLPTTAGTEAIGLRLSRSDRAARQSTMLLEQRIPGAVTLSLYDLQGRRLWARTLESDTPRVKEVAITWDTVGPEPLASGIYFVVAALDGQVARARLVVLR